MASSNKSTPKTSPHSRFIPREEIDEVAAWHFSAIGGATEPAPLEPESAEETVDMLTMHRAVHEAREQAFAEGHSQGHATGAQEVRDALEATTLKHNAELAERMNQVLKTMAEDLLDKEQDMARQILELSCEIARQVVRQEIRTNPRLLRPVIGEALEMIVDDGLPASVHMHPDDLARMHDALTETLGESAPDFVGDTSVTPGGCIIHTPTTTVNASIEKRWARAVGNLGLSIEWAAEVVND
jgi:flagellar assembly protein FliH